MSFWTKPASRGSYEKTNVSHTFQAKGDGNIHLCPSDFIWPVNSEILIPSAFHTALHKKCSKPLPPVVVKLKSRSAVGRWWSLEVIKLKNTRKHTIWKLLLIYTLEVVESRNPSKWFLWTIIIIRLMFLRFYGLDVRWRWSVSLIIF